MLVLETIRTAPPPALIDSAYVRWERTAALPMPLSSGLNMHGVVDRLLAESGMAPVAKADSGWSSRADGSTYHFAINQSRSTASVQAAGTDPLRGDDFAGTVAAGGMAVIAQD